MHPSSATKAGPGPRVDAIRVTTYVVPTDAPESDGTLEWDRTTVVVVELGAGGLTGLGYTYADQATAAVVRDTLADAVKGEDALAIPAAARRMLDRVRDERGLAGKLVPPLGKGAGILLTEDGGGYRVEPLD